MDYKKVREDIRISLEKASNDTFLIDSIVEWGRILKNNYIDFNKNYMHKEPVYYEQFISLMCIYELFREVDLSNVDLTDKGEVRNLLIAYHKRIESVFDYHIKCVHNGMPLNIIWYEGSPTNSVQFITNQMACPTNARRFTGDNIILELVEIFNHAYKQDVKGALFITNKNIINHYDGSHIRV